jgi:hypothetical protein
MTIRRETTLLLVRLHRLLKENVPVKLFNRNTKTAAKLNRKQALIISVANIAASNGSTGGKRE